MKGASDKTPGRMLAVVGLDKEKVDQVISEASKSGVVVLANHNSLTR